LLTKEFNSTEQKIELEGERDRAKLNTSFSTVSQGKFETDFKISENANFEIKQESNNNPSNNNLTGILTLRNLFPNAVIKTEASTNSRLNLGSEYRRDAFSATADLEYSPAKGSLIHVSSVYQLKKLSLGGKISLLAEDDLRVKEYAVGLNYETGGVKLTETFSENVGENGSPLFTAQLFQLINPQFSYAAKFTRSLERSKSPTKTTAEFGGQYKLSETGTVGAKIDHSAKIGLFGLYKLSPNSTLSQSFSLNLAQSSQPWQYGFALKFKV